MMNELSNQQINVAVVIQLGNTITFVVMYFTLGRIWKHHENGRRTAGIIAVLCWSAAGIHAGLIDWLGLLWVLVGFIVAGGVAVSLGITEEEFKRRKAEESALEKLDDGGTEA